MLFTWAEFHLKAFRSKAKLVTLPVLRLLSTEFLPASHHRVGVLKQPSLEHQILHKYDSPHSIYNCISSKVQDLISNNLSTYEKSNPSLVNGGSASSASTPVPSLVPTPTTPSLASFAVDGTSLDDKYRCPISTWRIFLSHVSLVDGSVVLPHFTDEFLEGFS